MNPEDQLVLFVGLVWLLVLVLFALPSVIAFRRGDPSRWLILAINASVAGWAVALIMAVYPLFRLGRPTGSDDGDAGRQVTNRAPPLLLASQAHAGAVPPAARLSAAAAVVEIERLGRLRVGGHLSEAEFASLKGRVLGRL